MFEYEEFSLTETSRTIAPGSGGALTIQVNLQGQVSGEAAEGMASGTMTVEYEPNMKSGTWSYCGMTAYGTGCILQLCPGGDLRRWGYIQAR